VLSERKSRNDELAKMRLDAYSDFLRATSHLVSARRAGRTQDQLVDLGSINDAKARFCVCPDAPVVEALAQFWLQGGTLAKEQDITTFAHLSRVMSNSLSRYCLPFDVQRSDILFTLEPPTYAYNSSREDG